MAEECQELVKLEPFFLPTRLELEPFFLSTRLEPELEGSYPKKIELFPALRQSYEKKQQCNYVSSSVT